MADRIWGLLLLLSGLSLLLVSRQRLRREAERDARRLQVVFLWRDERAVAAQVRVQLLLLRVLPPTLVVLGALVLLGVLQIE